MVYKTQQQLQAPPNPQEANATFKYFPPPQGPASVELKDALSG